MELIGPITPLFPYPLDSREVVATKAGLTDLKNTNTTYPYMKVVVADDGNTYELQPDGSWELFTAKGPKGDKGNPGEDGKNGADGRSLEFRWDGTKLGVRREGESDYVYTDLGYDLSDDLEGVETVAKKLIPIINELHSQIVGLQNEVAELKGAGQ